MLFKFTILYKYPTLVMFDSDMSDNTIKFKSETKNIVMVATIPNHKTCVWFRCQQSFCSFTRQWPPIPASLKRNNVVTID